MIRDRGPMKWTAMMLPEHVKLLRKYTEDRTKVPKPIVDEQDYDLFNQAIATALEEGSPLKFAYYEEGDIKEYKGSIRTMDGLKKELKIVDERNSEFVLALENIVGIENEGRYLGEE